jgi:hypothetical protein
MSELEIPLATFAVYWPGQITYTCEKHKNQLLRVASAMGLPPVDYQEITDTTFGYCTNCKNELKKKP